MIEGAYRHISNAEIKKPNSRIDSVGGSMGFGFSLTIYENKQPPLAFVTLSALFCGSAGATALTFDPSQVELHPSLTDKTAVAHFKFKNTGDKPVKILAVHPSCGCTTAQLAHDTIAPNETGEIVATFTIGQRTGVQKKDDHGRQPTIRRMSPRC